MEKVNNIQSLTALIIINALEQVENRIKNAAAWLNTPHTFGDDSEAVVLNGWQYLGVCVITVFACIFFSIAW